MLRPLVLEFDLVGFAFLPVAGVADASISSSSPDSRSSYSISSSFSFSSLSDRRSSKSCDIEDSVLTGFVYGYKKSQYAVELPG